MRSRAYPAVTLKEAVELLARIDHELGQGAHPRESITKAWGYKGPGGLPARKVAALVQFGLLERMKDMYKPSELGRSYLLPVDDGAEQAQALRAAVRTPTIFQEVLDRFEPEGKLPRQLGNILAREFGISPKVSSEVSQNILDSAVFAGVVSSEGVFANDRPPAEEIRSSEPSDANGEPETPSLGQTPPLVPRAEEPGSAHISQNSGSPLGTRPHPPEGVNYPTQDFQLALSGGTAVLRVPSKVSSQDLKKLKMLLDLVALGVEEST